MQHQEGVGNPNLGSSSNYDGGDLAEAASPISSLRPDKMASGGAGPSGNRWPRQETLALLQIRSEMDGAFRDAALKGPLWEQVSRKLEDVGFKRSAKKCQEKFENVHKYYKRTKEGAKTYKFFTQLQALNSPNSSMPPHTSNILNPPNSSMPPHTGNILNPPNSSMPPDTSNILNPPNSSMPPDTSNIGLTFSSHTDSSSDEDNDRKRKRSSTPDDRMMDFFQSLMTTVMQKQEAMQQKFLEAIEKREQDRMIREEAWKRQDLARLAREHHLMAQERSISATRDAAIIAFLEKITGETIDLPHPPTHQEIPIPNQPPQTTEPRTSTHIVALVPPEQQIPVQEFSENRMELTASSRWPKAEVLALIQLRSGMDSRYQELGPKGPLWEEISAGMQRMGYNRNAKRCKEKWENINKYFKKVKESNKKRSEDSKTCPYFHELDALYQKKVGSSSGPHNELLLGDRGMNKTDDTSNIYASMLPFTEQPSGQDGGPNQPEDMLDQPQKYQINSGGCFNNDDYLYEDDEEDGVEGQNITEYNQPKMGYKNMHEFNVRSSNGGGTASSTSLMTMVQ